MRKIAWLTPLGPYSDIGAHSLCIVDAMHRRAPEYDADVALFVQPNGPTYRSAAPRFMLDDNFDPELLSMFDVNILNIGNNQENHYHINKIALERGGVIVVHDMVMQHYLAWMIFEKARKPGRYVEMMAEHYGVTALELLENARITLNDRTTRYAPWDTPYASSFPLLEPFLAKAQAIIVHSQFAADFVATISDRPQLKLFLPSDKKPAAPRVGRQPEDPINFGVVGHIGTAKHIHYCIEAFRDSPALQANARLMIVGGASGREYVDHLQLLVKEAGLDHLISFHLNVTEQELFRLKSQTDVFVNVRYPNTESASGSLAEQLACGAPVIVYDSGCYSEMPEDTVYKIHDLATSDALRAAMEHLALDAEARTQFAEAALRYGQARTADAYACQFLDFVSDAGYKERVALPVQSGEYGPLNWLKPTMGNMLPEQPTPPWFVHPGNGLRFSGLNKLRGVELIQYLSLAVFQQSFSPQGRLKAAAILRGQPRSRIPLAFGRIQFFHLRCKTEMGILLGELDFENDPLAISVIAALQPELFVHICYRAILGRVPGPDEVERCVRDDVQSRPTDFIHGMLGSEEFQQRRLPRDLIGNLFGMASQIDTLQPRQTAPTAILGAEPLSVADLAEKGIFVEGWHDVEMEGIWSSTPRSTLYFGVAPDMQANAVLQLSVRVASTEWLGPQTITITMNDEIVATHFVTNNDRFTMEIPLASVDTSNVVMSLGVTKTIRIADYVLNGDLRDLGVFIFEMKLKTE
ncbi:glycosyltransferase [Acetobacteraceae bacterium H6797]|nr:glycosyltransferase [Acetobacteraceae bacterium H6797]